MKSFTARYLPILTVLLFSCSGSSSEENSTEVSVTTKSAFVTLTKEQLQSAELQFITTSFGSLNKSISVNGIVDVPPQSLISVSFPLGGYLKFSELLPGMKVKKGQLLAILEDISFVQLQQDYLVEQAKLEFFEQDVKRQKELNKEKINADKVLEKSLADFKAQKAIVKSLSEKLSLISINSALLTSESISKSVRLCSPIDGWVSKVNVNVGKYVTPSDVLFELVNPSDIHAALTVFEQDCRKLEIGQKVKVSLMDRQKELSASIILFNRNLDENKSVLVHCHFDESTDHLMPGMFLSGTIKITGDSSLILPLNSICKRGKTDGIFLVLDDNSFQFIPVEIDFIENELAQLKSTPEIRSLLGKKIVSKNSFKLLSALELEKEE